MRECLKNSLSLSLSPSLREREKSALILLLLLLHVPLRLLLILVYLSSPLVSVEIPLGKNAFLRNIIFAAIFYEIHPIK